MSKLLYAERERQSAESCKEFLEQQKHQEEVIKEHQQRFVLEEFPPLGLHTVFVLLDKETSTEMIFLDNTMIYTRSIPISKLEK